MRRGGFVFQKEASCDPLDPLDRLWGDDWDHTAVDPESRLLLALEPGKRDGETCERLIRQVHDRTGGRTDLLITSDEHAPYATAIEELSRVDGSVGIIVAAHTSLCSNHIYKMGSDEQRKRYLPKLASGEWLGCWSLAEIPCCAAARSVTAIATQTSA